MGRETPSLLATPPDRSANLYFSIQQVPEGRLTSERDLLLVPAVAGISLSALVSRTFFLVHFTF